MKIGWTPEIIASQVSVVFQGFSISHEAIYQYVYAQWPEGIIYLPHSRKKRYAKRYSNRKIERLFPIEQTLICVQKRQRIGRK